MRLVPDGIVDVFFAEVETAHRRGSERWCSRQPAQEKEFAHWKFKKVNFAETCHFFLLSRSDLIGETKIRAVSLVRSWRT